MPFTGAHQAGITTPVQDRLHFVALDVVTRDRAQLVDLLRTWTRAAERMTAGAEAAPGGVGGGGPHGVPDDTGEAFGLPASGLTLTIGFGPSLFDDRFGLADRRPAALQDLPAFRGDQLEPARSGGDLCIQACANDPQVAVHAVRNLIRLGFGVVAVRWSQLGFGRTSSTSTAQATPRNMFGFKDGTNNLKSEETAAVDEHVWVQPSDVPGGSSWMVGGSYLVARRIRMHIEVWDRTTLQEQKDVIGRTKVVGAPLGKAAEFDEADFSRKGADGQTAIPVHAHIALASSRRLGGIRILRRRYNFTDGTRVGSSCRCSRRSPRRTSSTSTSSTTARPCSPAPRGWLRAGTGATRSSPEPPRASPANGGGAGRWPGMAYRGRNVPRLP